MFILTEDQNKELQSVLDGLTAELKRVFAETRMKQGIIKINGVYFDLANQRIHLKPWWRNPSHVKWYFPKTVKELGLYSGGSSWGNMSIDTLLKISREWDKIAYKFVRAALKAESRMSAKINEAKANLKVTEKNTTKNTISCPKCDQLAHLVPGYRLCTNCGYKWTIPPITPDTHSSDYLNRQTNG